MTDKAGSILTMVHSKVEPCEKYNVESPKKSRSMVYTDDHEPWLNALADDDHVTARRWLLDSDEANRAVLLDGWWLPELTGRVSNFHTFK